MNSTFDVVGIGENSVDFVYRLPGPPAPNAKLPVSALRVSCGGQVATTLSTCAALGLRAAYVGTFGNDDNGGRIREALTRRRVDITHALVREAPNRYAVILVDERTGDRTVVWERDPRLTLNASDLPRDVVTDTRVLHVDDVDVGASLATARLAAEAGIPVTCDVDRVTGETAALVASVTVPILAEHVPAALTGEDDIPRALRALRRDHHTMIVVTLGTQGAMLLEGDVVHHVPAFEVDAVDTTGAGDVFRGAFIYAMLRGDGPLELLRFASAAAAVSCTREGAMDGVPTLGEVERVLTMRN